MKRILLSTISILFLILSTQAASKLSLQSFVKLNSYKHALSTNNTTALKSIMPVSSVNGIDRISAFITLKENHTLSQATINDLDLSIESEIGNIIIASIPVNNISQLEAVEAVEFIEIEQPIKMLCDSSRIATKVNPVHNGIDLPQAFKGKGVIVGIVD